jgi:nitrate/TMAO reductase-like tetraheme cytochrome c subunit
MTDEHHRVFIRPAAKGKHLMDKRRFENVMVFWDNTCAICGRRSAKLHQFRKTAKSPREELLKDVLPLCDDCLKVVEHQRQNVTFYRN